MTDLPKLTAGHTYVDQSGKVYTSVTTIIKQYFAPFDADRVIANMMRSKNWPQSPYYGLSPDQIRQKWKDTAKMGTDLHNDIDIFLRHKRLPSPKPEFLQFLQFYQDHVNKLNIAATELVVADPSVLIAGTLDALFVDNHGHYHLYDWKRVTDLRYENSYSTGSGPFWDLQDCNYVHYSLQLNLYSKLLEVSHNIRVASMNLVLLHPDKDNYQIVPVDNLRGSIDALYKLIKI